MLSYNFLDVGFSPPSDYQRAMRKVFVHELISEKRARSLWNAREVEVSRLINSFSEASPNPVDLHEKVISLADGILNVFAFGKNCGYHWPGLSSSSQPAQPKSPDGTRPKSQPAQERPINPPPGYPSPGCPNKTRPKS